MFDALMDRRPVRARRSLASGGSLLLHAALLLSLIAGSYPHVEPMAGPAPKVAPLILRLDSPGPAAPPPPAGVSGARAGKTTRPLTVSQEVHETAQPQAIPQELPEADAGQAGGGDSVGVDDGAQGGVPGGTVGGSAGGIPGGIPNGIPGSPVPALPGTDEPLYLIGEVRPPVRTRFVKPDYPAVARQARVTGTVILEIVVGRSGEVENLKVLRSDPLFDQAAAEAVRRWRYQPALQAGRPVRVYLTVRVEFGLI